MFIQSQKVNITPLVIHGLGGVYAHAQRRARVHTHACVHTHTDVCMKVISKIQACASLWLVHAWFKYSSAMLFVMWFWFEWFIYDSSHDHKMAACIYKMAWKRRPTPLHPITRFLYHKVNLALIKDLFHFVAYLSRICLIYTKCFHRLASHIYIPFNLV